ncbi:MAG: OmpA family protein [Cytophagaceae bacterium]|nr:OmpA family protein [Cytophagaceae bacterium]MDW8457077.1 OmpA family protein [Cytophagaceae bacterium]
MPTIILKGQVNNFIPQRLSTNVNSEYSELNPIISPDNKTLYFCRKDHPENKFGRVNSMDIWYSKLLPDGSWSVAERMPFPFNTARSNSILSISPDGKTFYISGRFSKRNVKWIKRGISYITLNPDSTFSKPRKIKIKAYSRKNRGDHSNAYISNDGKVMLLSYTKKWMGTSLDLYVSLKKEGKEKWTRPKKVRNINNLGSIEAPFLSHDNKHVYYASDRFDKKFSDIFRSSRTDETYRNWTAPVQLSDTINTVSWESYYKTNLKGSWAYFVSDRNGTTKSDIYRVKIYEENPYVVVSGTVINTSKNAPLASKYKFKIMADDKVVDSVTINPDSATFRFKLKLGAKYYIKADVKNFISTPEIIDVSSQREYIEKTQDLKVKPIPYVKVTGRLLNKKTNTMLPASSLPRVAVDGVIWDSVKIDLNNGTYSVNINYGKSYSLQVLADKFNPQVTYLDLNNIDEYQEITKDLYAEEVKLMAVISGKVYNKKTNKIMLAKIDYDVVVNDIKGTANIDKTTGDYRVEVPIGGKYTINATAPKYFPIYENIDLSAEQQPIRIYKDLYLVPLEVGQAVKLNNVFFETGKAELLPESFIELDKVVNFLNEFPEVKIEIGGHTDNVGKPQYNLELSDRRAASVANYIKSRGIDPDRITSKGYGMTKPVVPNTTKANKALNRRVEFKILDL